MDRERLEKAEGKVNADELKRGLPALRDSIRLGNTKLMPEAATFLRSKGLLCLADTPGGLCKRDHRPCRRLQHELETTHNFGELNDNCECPMCYSFLADR